MSQTDPKEAIRQSEESKRQLLNAVGDGIFGVDAKGRTTFRQSPAALRMLGFAERRDVRPKCAYPHPPFPQGRLRLPGGRMPHVCLLRQGRRNSHVEEEVFWRKDGS